MAGWSQAAGALFGSIWESLKLWGKHQDRVNDPKIVANVDAKRDLKEKEKLADTIEKSEKTKDLSNERQTFAED